MLGAAITTWRIAAVIMTLCAFCRVPTATTVQPRASFDRSLHTGGLLAIVKTATIGLCTM